MKIEEHASRKCPSCGKAFSVTCRASEWGYAYDGQLTCSYHCMRDMERAEALKPRRPAVLNSPAAAFLRSHLRGKTWTDLSKTQTAQSMNLLTAKRVKTFVGNWIARYPDEAQMIRDEIRAERTGVSRQELMQLCAAKGETVRIYAARLGISGTRCGKSIYYTKAEAARIVASFRTVSA